LHELNAVLVPDLTEKWPYVNGSKLVDLMLDAKRPRLGNPPYSKQGNEERAWPQRVTRNFKGFALTLDLRVCAAILVLGPRISASI